MRFCSGDSVMSHLTYHITNARNCQPHRCWNEWKAFSLQLLPGTPKHPIFGDEFTCHTLLGDDFVSHTFLLLLKPKNEGNPHLKNKNISTQHHHSTQGFFVPWPRLRPWLGGGVVGGPRTWKRFTYLNNCKTCGFFHFGKYKLYKYIFRYVYLYLYIYLFLFFTII